MGLYRRFEAQLAHSEASNRSFGFFFGALFLAVGFYPLWGGGAIRWWAVGIGTAVALLGWIAPVMLQKPKRAWLFLGFLLAVVVNPIVLAVLFFGVITPVGLVMRLLGRDALRVRLEPAAGTYWIMRTETGSNLADQF